MTYLSTTIYTVLIVSTLSSTLNLNLSVRTQTDETAGERACGALQDEGHAGDLLRPVRVRGPGA